MMMKKRKTNKLINNKVSSKLKNKNLVNFIFYTLSVASVFSIVITIFIIEDRNKNMRNKINDLKKKSIQISKKNSDIKKNIKKLEIRAVEDFKNPDFKLENKIIYYGDITIKE